jgi:predicted RNA-binding protein with PIN domain
VPRLVDGDNLLGRWPGRRRTTVERRALSGEIARHAARERRRIVVVFDGLAPDEPLPSHDAHFSGAGRSADDWILDFLRQQKNRRGWVVVTDDRSLGDRCRDLGATLESCRRFRERLLRREDGDKPSGPVDVQDWLEFFGEDRDP